MFAFTPSSTPTLSTTPFHFGPSFSLFSNHLPFLFIHVIRGVCLFLDLGIVTTPTFTNLEEECHHSRCLPPPVVVVVQGLGQGLSPQVLGLGIGVSHQCVNSCLIHQFVDQGQHLIHLCFQYINPIPQRSIYIGCSVAAWSVMSGVLWNMMVL